MICQHANSKTVKSTDMPPGNPEDYVCAECVKMGDSWLHLRKCLKCGHLACCDNSKNQHARKHFEKKNHPIIRTAQPEDQPWAACFIDDQAMEVSDLETFTHSKRRLDAHQLDA
jgi:uncharacterized UBP type Zn finger protein